MVNNVVSNKDGFGLLNAAQLSTTILPYTAEIIAPKYIYSGSYLDSVFVSYLSDTGYSSPVFNQNASVVGGWTYAFTHPEIGGIFVASLIYIDSSSVANLYINQLDMDDVKTGKFGPKITTVMLSTFKDVSPRYVANTHAFVLIPIPGKRVFVWGNTYSLLINLDTKKTQQLKLPETIYTFNYNGFTQEMLLYGASALYHAKLTDDVVAFTPLTGYPNTTLWTATPNGFETILANYLLVDGWYYKPIKYTISNGTVSSQVLDIASTTTGTNPATTIVYGNAALSFTKGYGGDWHNKYDVYNELIYAKVVRDGATTYLNSSRPVYWVNEENIPTGNMYDIRVKETATGTGYKLSDARGQFCRKYAGDPNTIIANNRVLYNVVNKEVNGWYPLTNTSALTWSCVLIDR